jgi:hypothetical protein
MEIEGELDREVEGWRDGKARRRKRGKRFER